MHPALAARALLPALLVASAATVTCTQSGSSSAAIAPAPSGYSRSIEARSPNGTALLVSCMERPQRGALRLGLRWSEDGGRTWAGEAVARSLAPGSSSGAQLSNCNLLQLPDGRYLVAYRHHSGCGGAGCDVYRIETSISSSADVRTATWATAGVVAETHGGPGLWEPKLFQLNASTVACLYSRELPEHAGRKEQSIVWHFSLPAGGGGAGGVGGWTPDPVTVAYNRGSRNGMPGIARLRNGDLVVVFESFWETWSHFLISMVRSRDNGVTFGLRRKVYESVVPGRNAGAPQVAVARATGSVVVSFLTNEGAADPTPWPGSAATKVAVAADSKGSLVFNRTETVVLAPSLWPNVFPVAAGVMAEYQDRGAVFLRLATYPSP